MKPLMDLQDDRTHTIRCMEDLVETAKKAERPLTEEEQGQIRDWKTQVESYDEQIKDVRNTEKAAEMAATLASSLREGGTRSLDPISPTTKPPEGSVESRQVPMRVIPRYSELKAFKGPDADRRAYNSGQWVRSRFLGDERARRYCREHGIETRAMSEGVNSEGGATVPDDFLQAVIDNREKYGVFRQNCNVVPMGRDYMTVPRLTTGTSATFTAENAAVTESDPVWDNVTLTAKKCGILTRMSTELAEDAIVNLADTLADDFAQALASKEDNCGFIGDGTAAYGGIVGATIKIIDGTHTAGAADGTAGHDSMGEVDATDLSIVMGTLPTYARPGAKWFCSQVAYAVVFERLAAAAGGSTIRDIQGGFQPSYMGYPIVITSTMQTTTTLTALNDDVIVMFGDLRKAAMLGDRRGLTVATSDQRYFDTDQIALRAIQRFDINVHGLGDNTTAGPLVALIGVT